MRVADRLKRTVRLVLGDYRLNWIYASPPGAGSISLPPGVELRRLTAADLDHVAGEADPQVRKLAGYARIGALGYVLAAGQSEPLSIAHFVDAARYDHRSIWPLRADQLALVDIVTLPRARGRGHAARLIAAATPRALATDGHVRAICFIWWNHRASIRAFRRAGWRAVGFSVELAGRGGRVRSWRARWRRS